MKNFDFSAIFGAVMLLTLAGCASGPDEPRAPLIAPEDQQSSEASASGNRDKAGTATASAADRDAFKQALAQIESGDLEKAESNLLALLENSPGLAAAHNNLGVIYRRTGRFEEAKNQYEAALSADPDNQDAHLNLGILYDIYLRQPAQALEHYERYQQLSSEPDEDVALWITDLQRRL